METNQRPDQFPEEVNQRVEFLRETTETLRSTPTDSPDYQQLLRKKDFGYERLVKENIPGINQASASSPYGLSGEFAKQVRSEVIQNQHIRIWKAISRSESAKKVNISGLLNKSKKGIRQDAEKQALKIKDRTFDGSTKKIYTESSLDGNNSDPNAPCLLDRLSEKDGFWQNSKDDTDFLNELEKVFGMTELPSSPPITLAQLLIMHYQGHNTAEIERSLGVTRRIITYFIRQNEVAIRDFCSTWSSLGLLAITPYSLTHWHILHVTIALINGGI
jgi:hypothetical protein